MEFYYKYVVAITSIESEGNYKKQKKPQMNLNFNIAFEGKGNGMDG